jgi:putative peptide maturation system protein
MHDLVNATIADVIDCLDEIATTQMPPTRALAHFHDVRGRHAEASLELVWEDQAFDGSIHYDALIRRLDDNKTISISVCPDDALPWALRGLHRWRDSELLRVNGITMAVEQAISQLDVLWEKAPLMQRLIDSCIIEGELQRRNVEVDAADVQAAFDTMRRRRGLFTVQALQAWIRDSGVSMGTLQDLATKRARAAKLKQQVVGENAEAHFAAHASDFDEIKFATVAIQSFDAAMLVADEIRSGRNSLANAAQDAFMKGFGQQLTLRTLDRRSIREEFGAIDLSAGAVHTIERDGQYLVVQILTLQVAQHSPATLAHVKTTLFQQWLADQRSAARVEWFWGDAQRTAQERAA